MVESTHTRSTRTGRDDRDGSRSQIKIVVPDDHSMVSLLGSRDELLHAIEQAFGDDIDIHVRGNEITVTGPESETDLVSRLFTEMLDLLKGGTQLTPDAVERSLAMMRGETDARPAEVLTLDVLSSRGRTIRPKTLNQRRYVDAIDKHTIVFGIGPAAPARRTWRWPRPSARCRTRRSTGSSSRARPWRRASGSASCPGRSTRRSTRTCGRSTTRCTTWSTPTRSRA